MAKKWKLKGRELDLRVFYHPSLADETGEYRPLFRGIFECPYCGAEHGSYVIPPPRCFKCGVLLGEDWQ